MRDPKFSDCELVRLKQIIAPQGPLPISRSTFYAKIKSGDYPAPLKLSARVSVWRASDIRELVERLK